MKTAARSVGAAALFLLVMRGAVSGALPTWVVAVLAPALLILAVSRRARPIIAIGTLIGLPTLGASGLVDPWETHYAEVAREMIARGDAISPWWANEGWFESKPVLLFWLEALSMRVLGVSGHADHVVDAGQHPEWALRLPGFLLALAGSYVLSRGVARISGRRAGILSALVLWTMPGFAILSRQAITDMPLVAGIAGSLGFALLALHTNDGRVASPGVSRLAAAAIALLVLPQIVAIALQGPLRAGSSETCMLPGHPACVAVAFAHPRFGPIAQAALWLAPLGALVLHAWDETRLGRLFALGAWACAAFATMAKGPAGLVVPAGAVLMHLLVTRSLRPLWRFEIAIGLLLTMTMVLPWYVALFARHGKPFLHELVAHHMFGRTLEHLHDTNEGEDTGIGYFVRQLGYATFPWSGFALASVLGIRDNPRERARAALFGAAMLAFALVSVMATKFHHYMLIALPPIAALTGIELEKPRRASLIIGALAAALIGRDLFGDPAVMAKLMSYRYARVWPSTHAFSTFFAVIAAIAVLALLARRVALLGAAAAALALVLVNLYVPRCALDGGQRALFDRYYAATDRKGPLVAYQLNWKGENFYSGDDTAIFIASGAPFRKYLDERRTKDERVVYAITERSRTRGLKNELGAVSSFEELTTNAEFTLIRATLY